MMYRYLTITITSVIILCFGHHTSARQLAQPQFIALYAYADWCGSCKILEPKLQQVRQEKNLDKKDILFVTLDLSDKTHVHQSVLLAQGLGVTDFLKSEGSKTGYMVILDANSKEEKVRFTAYDEVATISESFDTLLDEETAQ